MAGGRSLVALHRLAAGGPPDTDAELLARFADTGDEPAFAALVRRHGPLVRAVCRRHLRQPADVDDAVQATFLALARKAGAVHTAVGPWLYRVAERTASRLRRSTPATEPLPDVAERDGLPADVRAVVVDEVGRLPPAYRMAVELCYVTGYSTAEAAARLGWPKGTVLTRLAWARKRLRANLTRRGVTLGGSLAVVLADRATATGGRVSATSGSGRVLSLCEGVTRAMTLTKLGWAAGLAAVAVAATGVAVGPWATAQPPTSLPTPSRPGFETPVKQPPADPTPAAVSLPQLPDANLPKPVSTPTQPLPSETSNKFYRVAHPAGSFAREFAGGERFAVRFEDDRLYVEATFGGKEKPATLTLDADYAMNKEGVVFGVVTGAEYDGPDQPWVHEWTGLVGEPFAFRLRTDDGAVTVKDVRIAGARSDGRLKADVSQVFAAMTGRYLAVKEAVAATRKPGKPKLPRLDLPLTIPASDEGLRPVSPAVIPDTRPVPTLPAGDGPVPLTAPPVGPQRG